jgi:hypothetical protein
MYELFLTLHSWLRWAAILVGVLAVSALLSKKPAPATEDRWGLFYIIALDLQLVIGLLLYFAVSPNMAAIRENFGAAMRDPAARFWAVEHIGTMFLAIFLAHLGRVLGRKAANPGARRGRLLICFAISLILMLVGTPWPGMASGRPLFRV